MPPSVALCYDKHAQETTIRELAPYPTAREQGLRYRMSKKLFVL